MMNGTRARSNEQFSLQIGGTRVAGFARIQTIGELMTKFLNSCESSYDVYGCRLALMALARQLQNCRPKVEICRGRD